MKSLVSSLISDFKFGIKNFSEYHNCTVPLCAAENVISDFVKYPLKLSVQERYIMNSDYSFTETGNFIGAEYLLPFYKSISEICRNDFGANFTDSRTLTGMNCIMLLLMSLTKIGDNIMILGKEHGGHASVEPICKRLGLNVIHAPYSMDSMEPDYDCINNIIKSNRIRMTLLAPSDLISDIKMDLIDTNNTIVVYDATQLLGMIQVGVRNNPLKNARRNFIMIGGTHKTLAGPTHALMMTNDRDLFSIIDRMVNPTYIRNTQMHQVLSLLCALIENHEYGQEYQNGTIKIANSLADCLKESLSEFPDIKIIDRNDGSYTQTHQIFLECPEYMMSRIHKNAVKSGVTLNTKEKELFHGCGIRLGTQEISRYKWGIEDLRIIASIFRELASTDFEIQTVQQLKAKLSDKKIYYTFSEDVLASL